ncbi:MarR family winged helix-turn-helix transcriptional regulator [Allonocardiopsis opalescens]|uniref:MarR family protein n=1 Tax=Allonocardiopsis opalescens TaxID=1144618 RepID=A0A2T0Q4R4_9ACTN|nr:MarR family transcriptional regulator [Allonocardiopsis opalescens]PRX98808.1 MarR family protein [Allonocardiopsis opalescens]
MHSDDALSLAAVFLAAGRGLVDAIHADVTAHGYRDLRPVHGFAFSRLAPDGATVSELAAHLDVTKQAASQMVDELVRKGYVQRRAHPADARARLVVLTERGRACTRAAERAAQAALRPWAAELGERRLRELAADLARVAPGGPLRPIW